MLPETVRPDSETDFPAAACGEDAALLAKVEDLLIASDQADQFFRRLRACFATHFRTWPIDVEDSTNHAIPAPSGLKKN